MPDGKVVYPYGPYYRSAIREEEVQRKALTGEPLSPKQLSGIALGELEARYTGEQERRAALSREEYMKAQTEHLKWGEEFQEKEAKRAERTATVGGIATLGGLAGMIGALPATTTGAAAVAGSIGALASPPVAVSTAGTVFNIMSYLLSGLVGCCFTFIEGDMLTSNVRRYRDEHYNKYFSPVSFGYIWMSIWLVPLMRKYSFVKQFVKYIILRPLTIYADWYYGENHYGWVFYPIKMVMTNLWRIIGIIVKGGLKWQVGSQQ